MNIQLRLRYLVLLHMFTAGALVGRAQAPTNGTRHLVEINTTAGRMVVELFNETPLHRDNFLKLAKEHYYDSTLFHRVISGFMIQGGDPDSRNAEDRTMPLGNGGPDYTVPAEFRAGLFHRKGALAAARESDDVNPEKRSSGSQFYLVQGRVWPPSDLARMEARQNAARADSLDVHYTPEQIEVYHTLGGTPHLDGNYTVFGQLVEGMEVLDRIAGQACDDQDRPLTDVRMWMRVIQ
ncbi:MAG: peptidylprolyl isomerase [Flavobacteriales bacterium]|nr:peptidylprolyl isomerase [Flavobacteriales bacterium]